jgi:hypothetical protein
MKPFSIRGPYTLSYCPVLSTDPNGEGAPHFPLLPVESASGYYNSVTYLPKVRPGDAVHHRVADPLHSLEEQLVLASLPTLLVLCLSLVLTDLAPFRAFDAKIAACFTLWVNGELQVFKCTG